MVTLSNRLFLSTCASLCVFATPACAQDNTEDRMVAGLARDADRPLESIPGVASHYGMVETADGARLRTIITTPDEAGAPCTQ